MKLLFVTPAFPPFTGGGERYARSLALSLARAGHTVTVVTSDAQQERDFWRRNGPAGLPFTHQDGPLTVIRCPLRGLPGGFNTLLGWRKAMVLLSALPGDRSRQLSVMAGLVPPIRGLEEVLQQVEEADLVVGFNLSWESASLAAWRFAQSRQRPFALVPFAHLGEKKNSRMGRNNTMDHQRRLVAGADVVLALTEAEVQGFNAWGIQPPRLVVVGGGLDPLPQLPDPAGILAHYGLQPPFAMFVGRVNFDKGTIHAAQATLALRQTGIPLTLALAGRVAPDFARFYERLSPAERAAVRPLGVIGEVEKHALLQAADMFLLPSRTESFGIVLLEAWIHGTPVIGANVGGVGSVVADGQDGLLVPFGDVRALQQAIRRLLEEPGLKQRLGEHGRQKVLSQYTWEQVAARAMSAFDQVVAGR